MNKITDAKSLVQHLAQAGLGDQILVMCHGVFDVVHPGHLEHFKRAKELGSLLVVSVTSDEFVNKGPGRPKFSLEQRMLFLSSIEIIDYVVPSMSPSAIGNIKLIKPSIYAKGDDYLQIEADKTGKMLEEKLEVEKWGGKVFFTSGFRSSSTSLINTYLSPLDESGQNWLGELKRKFTYEDIFGFLDSLRELKMKLLGEFILDEYTFCTALSKSSKDPILAFHKLETEAYLGGIFAIADNCKRWCQEIEIVFPHGNLDAGVLSLLDNRFLKGEILEIVDRDIQTIKKHRFVDKSSNQRVFEFYDFDPKPVSTKTTKKILEVLKQHNNKDNIVLVADYGHGLFTNELVSQITQIDSFLAINTQANAGNRGFNTISKYSRADFISLNGGELQLELRSKNVEYIKVIPEIMERMRSRHSLLTLGSEGLMVFDNFGNSTKVPALSKVVVDKVGAGDSVFAVATLLSRVDAPIEVIGLVASIVAANEISQLGHRSGLELEDIKRNIKILLG
jgi:cytidyltransferase-like protein